MNYPKRNKKKNNKTDRWSNVEKVVDEALEEMGEQEKMLEHFWRDCRRWYSDTFGTMSLETFKHWNDQRLSRLGEDLPKRTFGQALRDYQASVADVTWPENHDWRNGSP